ncbi:phosphopantetheine-binding protein, partial [Streptomyces sp. O3]
ALGQELYPTLLFEYPTVRSLAAHLRDEGMAPQAAPAPAVAAPAAVSLDGLITGLVAEALGSDDVPQDRGFYDLGLTSVNLLAIAGKLEEALGQELYPT